MRLSEIDRINVELQAHKELHHEKHYVMSLL
jgi:hypothetical protein